MKSIKTKVRELNLPNYSSKASRRIVQFMPLQMVLMLYEIQTSSKFELGWLCPFFEPLHNEHLPYTT